MAYFLFVDESGQDHKESPYEVLAGVAIQDRALWPLICDLKCAELECFGGAYLRNRGELKAKRLLKTKTFRLAAECEQIAPSERRTLAKSVLDNPNAITFRGLCALAQAKLMYIDRILDICVQHDCRVFASIIVDHELQEGEFLRKDYSYLFERFYHFLNDSSTDDRGIVVFDETEKSQSHLLIGQLTLYFRRTANGKARAAKIIPEPFFVHSDLTTGIQLADIAAYLLSWGYRHRLLTGRRREELAPYADRLHGTLGYQTERLVGRGNSRFKIHSIKILASLRSSRRRPFRLRRE